MTKRTRSSKSGRFVAAIEAFRNPDSTVTETGNSLARARIERVVTDAVMDEGLPSAQARVVARRVVIRIFGS